jgi:hypothetical protein
MNDLNISELRKKLGISQKKLAETLGVHVRTVQNWEAGGEIPQSKHTILRTILTQSDAANDAANESRETNHRRLIPFYDAETTGGFNGKVSSSNQQVSLIGYIDAGDWFDGRETAAIRHVGDSMTEYPDGCILAVREVRERRLLVPGQNYVIETDEYRITKRMQKGSSESTIALYSSNNEKYEDGRLIYEPFEVLVDDIRRIYSILGYVVNQNGQSRFVKL